MASHPDTHPDQLPEGLEEDLEHGGETLRPPIEDSPGTDGGTSGTGGTNHRGDRDITS